jgi:UDP-N-acetyl-D-glucosamine dehydrogenase
MAANKVDLEDLISDRSARVGVVGLGYVGLPLACAICDAGFVVVGVDIDRGKVESINAGKSYIGAISADHLGELVNRRKLRATDAMEDLAECDVIIVCVPTPLAGREPDLRFVVETMEAIVTVLRPGQLVVLESTTYPGTTEEVVKPILEQAGLLSGTHFYLGYSPEREDPGNPHYRTVDLPKIVSGDGSTALSLVSAFYGAVVKAVVPVSSMDVGEAVKITENVFRAVNIALVNELKVIYASMGIDVWEVIDAAATKPFGYMPFYPGPGLGGHCIPIDPFYLAWRAKQTGTQARFVELAGEVNVGMPEYVVGQVRQGLRIWCGVDLGSARVLIVGAAYKKNVDDIRESPSLVLIDRLEELGAEVVYHDPFVPEIMPTRLHPRLSGRRSRDLVANLLKQVDAVLIATDHDDIDYQLICDNSRLVVDARNAMARRGLKGPHIIKA